MIPKVKLSKANNSVNNNDGVMVSYLCTSSDNPLYSYKVSCKYLKGFVGYCADTKS